jgi:hypothetical protein
MIGSWLKGSHLLKSMRGVKVESYKDYTLPRGIVLEKDGKYRLIDGYHRVSACNKSDNMLVIVAKKE